MAGYVIHLAVAQEYLKKHNSSDEEYNEFIKGVIFPDSVSDKSLTHYGRKSSKVVLRDFLKENDLNSSFNRGYFLHLVTDYLFYNKYLTTFSKSDMYNDYDILNKILIDKFNVQIPLEIQNCIFYKEGETKLLSLELAEKLICEISDLSLEDIQEEIIKNPNSPKWLKFNDNIK